MIKVLFICHGNICRSAAAEMVMKQMAREQGRRDLQTCSYPDTSLIELLADQDFDFIFKVFYIPGVIDSVVA